MRVGGGAAGDKARSICSDPNAPEDHLPLKYTHKGLFALCGAIGTPLADLCMVHTGGINFHRQLCTSELAINSQKKYQFT